jgi:hypothetical protein
LHCIAVYWGAAPARAEGNFWLTRMLGGGPALLQRQAQPGGELVIGARRDPLFGPIVMAGLGGVWIAAVNDVAPRVIGHSRPSPDSK